MPRRVPWPAQLAVTGSAVPEDPDGRQGVITLRLGRGKQQTAAWFKEAVTAEAELAVAGHRGGEAGHRPA